MRGARLGLVALLILLAGVAAAPAQAKFRYTHKVSVEGEFVNNWTINGADECASVGSGTVTVKFHTTKAFRVTPYISRFASAWSGHGYGSWIMGAVVDHFGHVANIRAQRGAGTVTRVDNTTPRPRDTSGGGEPCPAQDRSLCRTDPLRGVRINVSGYDRRHVHSELSSDSFGSTSSISNCGVGDVDLFSSPPAAAGGNSRGELVITMPSARTLKRRRVVKVTGTSHKKTSFSEGGDSSTNDVTRKITVTFTRL